MYRRISDYTCVNSGHRLRTNVNRDHLYLYFFYFFYFFLASDFCWFCVVIRFFHPRHNGQWPPTSNDFLSQILSITLSSYLNSFLLPLIRTISDIRYFYPLHLFSYLYSSERASIFPFQCYVLNKGTIFITSLVWQGIEPGTSRTRRQHYTTRLSRRQYERAVIWSVFSR